MSSSAWRVAGASVAGFSHIDHGLPCDDDHAIVVNGGRLVALAADGAGSAIHGGRGAQVLCRVVTDHLARAFSRRSPLPSRPLSALRVRAAVIKAVEKARTAAADEAKKAGGALSDFHATLVGCVVEPSGGFFFHIGDGAACAVNPDEPEDFVISPPENGPYAETTFFFTEDDWRDHLRLTPIAARHTVITLMSDGVTPLALTRGPAPFEPFLKPVSAFLASTDRATGEAALTATLASEKVREITADDKTFVWASRSGDA